MDAGWLGFGMVVEHRPSELPYYVLYRKINIARICHYSDSDSDDILVGIASLLLEHVIFLQHHLTISLLLEWN